jgi:hypothetical protein
MFVAFLSAEERIAEEEGRQKKPPTLLQQDRKSSGLT